MMAHADSSCPAPATAPTVVRTVNAARPDVFAAWTEPALIRRWGTGTGSIDPRVGERIRRQTRSGTGLHVVWGDYREVVPGRRLVLMWQHESRAMPSVLTQTIITVELRERGPGRTEVCITEEPLAVEDRVAAEASWSDVLDALEPLLAATCGVVNL